MYVRSPRERTAPPRWWMRRLFCPPARDVPTVSSLWPGPIFFEPLVSGSHLGVCLACGALGQLVLLGDDVWMSPYFASLCSCAAGSGADCCGGMALRFLRRADRRCSVEIVEVIFGASVAFSDTQWNRLPSFAGCLRNAFSTHSGADRRRQGCTSARMSLSTLALVTRAHALAGGRVRGRHSMATRLGETDRGRKYGGLWLLRQAAIRS